MLAACKAESHFARLAAPTEMSYSGQIDPAILGNKCREGPDNPELSPNMVASAAPIQPRDLG
jgi:hypothetical protein